MNLIGKTCENSLYIVNIKSYNEILNDYELFIIDRKTAKFKYIYRKLSKNNNGQFFRIKGMYFYLKDFN